MSQVMRLCEDDARVACWNCDWTGTGKELDLMSDFEERVYAGEPCPAGQCPECACLAHLVEPLSDHERAHFEGGVMPVDKRLHVK
jgi:hypothetical protein